MTRENPFAVSMATMIVPAHMGSNMNVAGFEIVADDTGKVEVPAAMVATLKAHGLMLESDLKPVEPAVAQRPGQRPTGTVKS